MRFVIAFVLSVTMMAAAQRPNAIPRGAVKSVDGSYRYTDTQGKKWVYRATPFGVARVEDKPVAAEPPAEQRFADVKAFEAGDHIRFERPSPFGIYKWERAKTELTAMEKAVWEREKDRAAKKD